MSAICEECDYHHHNGHAPLCSKKVRAGLDTPPKNWDNTSPHLKTTKPADDPAIRPAHYKVDDPYEAIKVMVAWHGAEATINFCHLTAEKYLARAGKKDGESKARDFAKARWYLDTAIKLLEEA